jgi:hypothetical protein
MDTEQKRQIYRVILKFMAWFGILFLIGVFLRGCFG